MAARIGRYEIVSTLGRGGMAVVYEVQPVDGTERLALKLLGDAGPEVTLRFQREAKLLAALGDHPGVVRLRDSGEERGRLYIVMDLLRGGSLEDRLVKGMDREKALAGLVTVARTLHAAHEAGIVHRDVKPANVLLDESGAAHLADFGIAKELTAETLTKTGTVLGTYEYMAPEQLDRAEGKVDRRTDVYALGAILYRILAGRPPVQGTGAAALKQILVDPPVPPSRDAPGTPPELERIALKALEKDGGKRHPTAEAFAVEVEQFLRGSAPGRSARGARTVTLVAAVVALAGIVGLGRAVRGPAQPAVLAPVTSGAGVAVAPVDEPSLREARELEANQNAGLAALRFIEAARHASGTEPRAALVDHALDLDLGAAIHLEERAASEAFEILTKAALETLHGPGASTEAVGGARQRLFRARLLRPDAAIPGGLEVLEAVGVAFAAGAAGHRDWKGQYDHPGGVDVLEASVADALMPREEAAVDHDALVALAIGNPGHGRLLILIGSTAEALGRPVEAEVLYEIGSRMPGLAAAWKSDVLYRLGTKRLEHGRIEEALALFDRSGTINPGNWQPLWGRARAYMQLPAPRAAEARQILEALSKSKETSSMPGFQELFESARAEADRQKQRKLNAAIDAQTK
jgi:tetratricopeptide (TPR) repeat protein